MTEINLILKRKELSAESLKRLKVIKITAIIFLIATFLSAAAVFYFKFNSPLSDLRKEESKLISQLSSSKAKIAKMVVLNDRIGNASAVLSGRSNFGDIIDILTSDKNLQIRSFTLNKKNITMTIYSSSLFSINSFIDNIVLMSEKKEYFKKINLNGLSSDEGKGFFSFSFEADLL